MANRLEMMREAFAELSDRQRDMAERWMLGLLLDSVDDEKFRRAIVDSLDVAQSSLIASEHRHEPPQRRPARATPDPIDRKTASTGEKQ